MTTYNGKFLTRPELEALGVICDGDDVSVHTSAVIINPEGRNTFSAGLRAVTFCNC